MVSLVFPLLEATQPMKFEFIRNRALETLLLSIIPCSLAAIAWGWWWF